VLFAGSHPVTATANPAEVVEDDVALIALTTDALLHHGHWTVIGKAKVAEDSLPWPAYKEATAPGVFDVVDYTGERRRPATSKEIRELPFRKIVAPFNLERALQAMHGKGEWKRDDLLPPPPHRTTRELLATTN
jgi:hypothetical protein